MDKNKLIVGNMKMYMNTFDVKTYLQNFHSKQINKQVVLCPTDIFIPYFLGNDFSVGVQNIASTNLGAYTGELGAEQVATIGIKYTILGHSERRMYFNETSEEINKKIKQAIKHHITPIVCIGETLEEYEKKITLDVLRTQLSSCLTNLTDIELSNIIIAYEPIWAIGTGIVPTNSEIESAILEIKTMLKKLFNSFDNKVLYGGSVSSNNIHELEQIKNLDGYLIGSASTKVDEMLKILEVVSI